MEFIFFKLRSLAIGRSPGCNNDVGGVTAGKANHNASNARGVTAGKMGRNSSVIKYAGKGLGKLKVIIMSILC